MKNFLSCAQIRYIPNENSAWEKIDLSRFLKEDMLAYMLEIFFFLLLNSSSAMTIRLFGISIDR